MPKEEPDNMRIIERDYPHYLSEAHRQAVHKPAFYANGKARPAKRNELQKLIDKWTPKK